MIYTVALALSVALSALTIGAILSTALLIGPAAAALRLARSPGRAAAWAAGIGVAVTWAGIVLAYDSYTWPPAHRGWPVSFFRRFSGPCRLPAGPAEQAVANAGPYPVPLNVAASNNGPVGGDAAAAAPGWS